MKRQPRYPIFIPSKGRIDNTQCTMKLFHETGVDYKLVIEPQDRDAYAKAFGAAHVLVLPENDRGLIYSRNWIKDYSVAQGHERHWQWDDDINWIERVYRGYRLRCPANVAIVALEDFIDRYENVALASFNSAFFVPLSNGMALTYKYPPFFLNMRCYTVFLMLNSLPNRWRFHYNEDTDMTLQVLADGWCTILFNAFLIKPTASNVNASPSGKHKTQQGGQAGVYSNDGRLKMARDLERVWPGVVTTYRRFQRPQHKVKDSWKRFDTKLKRKGSVKLEELAAVDNYGLVHDDAAFKRLEDGLSKRKPKEDSK